VSRKYFGTFEGEPQYRWTKMHQGKRYSVKCRDLPITRDEWTKPGSYQAAKDHLQHAIEKDTTAKHRETEQLVEQVVHGQAAAEVLRIRDNSPDPMITEAITSAVIGSRVPHDATLAVSIGNFLAILRTQQKPQTYRELRLYLGTLSEEYGQVNASKVDEAFAAKVYAALATAKVSQPVKKKRWGFFKRFVKHLYTARTLDRLPRTFESTDFRFKTRAKTIKKWPVNVVRQSISNLPYKLRAWAMLGLNCGMTNADIGALTKEMVSYDYLTRKRVKTDDTEGVPTVTYKLWPETLALMKRFKSDHETLWFTSSTGTPLVHSRIEDGRDRATDLIASQWQKHSGDCPVPISKFRNAAAQVLGDHREFGLYCDFFLGHSPKSLRTKFYAPESQKVFDEVMDWLRAQILGPVPTP
jgi:hypothetical protein